MTRFRLGLGWIPAIVLAISMPRSLALDAPSPPPLDLGLGTQISYDPSEADLDRVRDAGFTWLRTVVLTSWIEPTPGVRDYAKLDRLLEKLSQRGLSGVLVLFDDPARPPLSPQEQAAFAQRAADIAQRCGDRNMIFEVWNEPNSSRFWGPKPDPSAYASLAITTTRAIKAVSRRPVLVMSTSKIDPQYIIKATRAQPELLSLADGFSIHPYVLGRPEANLAVFDKLSATLRDLAKGGRVPPLYCTEYGFFTGRAIGSVPESVQAAYLLRGFFVNQIKGLPLSIAYCLWDIGPNPNDPEHNFGMVCLDGRRKTALQAMTKLATELRGCVFVDRWRMPDPQVYVVRFRRLDGGWTLAAWTLEDEPKRIRLPISIPNNSDPKIRPAEPELKAMAGAEAIALTVSPMPRLFRLPADALFHQHGLKPVFPGRLRPRPNRR